MAQASPTPYSETIEAAADRLHAAFQAHFGSTGGSTDGPAGEVCMARAPGRVNLMGGHTDYNEGFVLPMTLGRAVYVALRRREDQQVRLHSLNFEDEVAYPLADPSIEERSGWASYACGVVEELRRRDLLPAGFEGVIYGDVPLGAGLSSSAALEVAVALALGGLFDLDLGPVETAQLCQRVEHTYVGVECGIMDQFAARLGQARHALFLDCRTLACRHIPLRLENACFVITDSRAARELTASKYNERRAECDEAVRFFARHADHVTSLRDVSQALFARHARALPEPLRQRCRHVIDENQRVREGSRCLAQGQLGRFGELMNASHASLKENYEVSSPELDALVGIAQQVEGVLGARMTGAGFGGCTVTLVRRPAAEALKKHLRHRYRMAFGRTPNIYVMEDNIEAGVL